VRAVLIQRTPIARKREFARQKSRVFVDLVAGER
jgi:hypothetical protein